MILYLIKSAFVLSLLYCSFAVLLSRETFHRLNRLLLIGTLWASLLLPLVRIHTSGSTAGGRLLAESVNQLEGNVGFTLVVTPDNQMDFTWSGLLLGVYLLGVTVMLAITLVQAVKLCRFMSGGLRHTDNKGNTVILKPGEIQPFSVLRYIMMSVADYERYSLYILAHEQEHIRLGHSYDLMLLEVVKILQWFNPFVWMLEQDMLAIHEYEADMAVIKQGIDAKTYQQLLVVKVMGNRLQPFSNNLAHGSFKKRIFMMYQKKSNRWKMLKALCIIPVSGLALYVFATPENTFVPKKAESSAMAIEVKDSVYDTPDVMPEYEGGMEALFTDLTKTMRYPKDAQEVGAQARVVLSFVVDKNGQLADIKPALEGNEKDENKFMEVSVTAYRQQAQKNGKELTEEDIQKYIAAMKALKQEAVRSLKALPGKWKPGRVNDEPVSVHYTLPVSFRLN